MDSKTGLIIQFTGVCLIAILFSSLTKSLKFDTLRHWKKAWIALSIALLSLCVAFNFALPAKPFLVIYYFGEYVFAYLLIAGCRSYAFDENPSAKSRLLLIPAFIFSLFLAFPVSDFNIVFNFHSFILAVSITVAFFTLKTINKNHQKNSGLLVMKIALLLLALNFLHYTIIFTLIQASYTVPLPNNYLAYNPIIDFILEILLGFGMIITIMERVRREVEETNRQLEEARDKLEKLANIDPLTTAFTRHAFYGFLQKHGGDTQAVSGCVGVFDIDNLKPINDRYGHAVGDVAISTTARAIRSLIRADDLIFRWGGDEFFVIMLGFDDEQARLRMSELSSTLTDVRLYGLAEKVSIGVSFGFAAFSEIGDLEKAVKDADAEMYKAKQANKQKKENDETAYSPIQKNPSQSPVELF
jgi:diguanylate cyclase (GGDEF)-like protein